MILSSPMKPRARGKNLAPEPGKRGGGLPRNGLFSRSPGRILIGARQTSKFRGLPRITSFWLHPFFPIFCFWSHNSHKRAPFLLHGKLFFCCFDGGPYLYSTDLQPTAIFLRRHAHTGTRQTRICRQTSIYGRADTH